MKKKSTFTTLIASLMVMLNALPAAALGPNALPTGGQITSGTGTITQSGSAMTISQTTERMIANWSTFNIGRNASVTFNQPSSSAMALNRIFDQNPSQIFGSLRANGQIFLINPQGIYFGPTATVDVGGLVASSLRISSASFLSGNYTFFGKGTGSIVNQGSIKAADYGYVAFISPVISNQGSITATNGTIGMAAGNKVSLDFTGDRLVNFTVDKGAIDALIENKGLIQADGGMVMMTAKAASALTSAVINNSGVIEARTLENRSGRILLISDKESGETVVGGTLDASAPNSGDGGYIETSAAKVSIKDDARITTAAPFGKAGTWLIDPNDFTVAASGGDVTGAALTGALGSTDVTIQTTSGSASCTGVACGSGTSGNGDIFVNDSVTWSSHTLTLNAYRNIQITSELYGSGTAKLSLLYGQGAVAAGNTATYAINAPVDLSAGSNFSTKLGSDGALNTYTVITSLGSAGSTTGADLQGMAGGLGGKYALGANIDASATSGWNSSAGFNPVGNSTTNFTGAFDGLGHTITGLTINRSSTDFVGLFGYVGPGGSVSNVGLMGGSVTGAQRIGSLVGRNEGTICNAYTSATATGTNWVGELVGINYGAGTITNSYAAGTVNGGSWTGGLVGDNQNDQVGSGIVHITNSYTAATVHGTTDTGGLVGYNDGTITNTYATSTVTGVTNSGGLVGHNLNAGIINSSYASGTVSGVSFTGGLVGKSETGATINSPSAAVSSAAIKSLATFSGWSIDDAGGTGTTWRIYDGDSSPLLRSFLTPASITSVTSGGKTYDGTAFSGGFGYDVPGTTGHISYGGGAQGASNAGSYALTIYSDQQGYDLTGTRTANLTINPASLTLSTSNVTKTYDGGTSASGTAVAVNGTQVFAGDSISGGTFAYTDKNAGSGNKTVTVSGVAVSDGNSGNNYTVTYASNTTSTINPLAVTLTAPIVTKTYDGGTSYTTTAANLSSLSGSLVGTDTVSAATISYANKNAGSGNKTVTLDSTTISDGNSGNNYTVTKAGNTTSTINPANLTLSTSNVTKTYDGGTSASGTAVAVNGTQVFAGDSISGGTFAYTDKNAGSGNKTVTVSGVAVSDGNSGNNYTVTYASNTTSTINPANLTLSTSNVTKTYDGGTSASGTAVAVNGTQVFAGDSISGGTFAYTDKNAGSGNKTVTVSGVAVSDGNSGNNYTVTYASNTTSTINPKNLTAAYTAQDKTYDGTTSATVTGSSTAVASGDTVNFSQTAAFGDKNAGTGKTVNITGISLSGGDSGNYSLQNTTATATADITPKNLTVTANDDAKIYTGAPYSGGNGVTYTGLVGGETGAVLAGTLAYGGTSQGAANAGSYTIVPSGLTSGNYTIGFVNGRLTITPNDTIGTVPSVLTSVQNSVNSTQQGQGNGASSCQYDVTGSWYGQRNPDRPRRHRARDRPGRGGRAVDAKNRNIPLIKDG